ncbi:hypothetical protein B7L70_07115 [Vulcanisaeta sp. EB80]|nr:hypothetical protein B7L70_07115 [Vulcanisaeta sp. EB80]
MPGVVIMVRGFDRFGQARIMEAIAATVIILVLAALMPMLFKSPTTQLQSQVESNLETYAQTVLAELINNPHFLTMLEHCLSTHNCEALRSLMNTLVGPQYDWYVAVVPYGKLVTSTSIVSGGEYALLPITVVVNWKTASPIQVPYPTTDPRVSELTLNVYLLNELLTAFGYKYQINTALPLSNVAFIQCANQSITNITECIESGQAVMLRWWLTYFDARTGTAVVWVNATGNIYMEVSSNSSLPYDVLTNSYCQEPYCYDQGLGGYSYLMLNAYEEPYALAPSFTDVNYTTRTSLSCLSCISDAVCTRQDLNGAYHFSNNYLVKLKTNNLTQYGLPPPTVSCNASLKLPSEPFGYSVYAIGQLITAIPGSTVTYNVTIEAVPYNLTSTQPRVSQNITVLTTLTYYGNGTEVVTTNITTSTGSRSNSTRLPQYYYLYLLSMDIGLNGICKTSSKPVNLTVSTTIYDFPTTLSNETSTTYPLPCDLVQNQIGYNITITEINVTQSSPNPQGYNYYVYNTTSIIYDMWVSGMPTTTYYLPVYVSYSFDKLSAMSVVHMERYRLGGFSPTASAFAVVQLNGTYYLVYVGISSLAGG